MSSHITDRKGSGADAAKTGAAKTTMASAKATILSTFDLPRGSFFLFDRRAVGQPVPIVNFFHATIIQHLGHHITYAVGQIMAVLLDRHTDLPFRRVEVRRRHFADRELGLVRSQ